MIIDLFMVICVFRTKQTTPVAIAGQMSISHESEEILLGISQYSY